MARVAELILRDKSPAAKTSEPIRFGSPRPHQHELEPEPGRLVSPYASPCQVNRSQLFNSPPPPQRSTMAATQRQPTQTLSEYTESPTLLQTPRIASKLPLLAVPPHSLTNLSPGRLDMWDKATFHQQVLGIPETASQTSPRRSDGLGIHATNRQLLLPLPPSAVSQQPMAMDNEDDLLDDESLDMLVTTLARETARIEAALGGSRGDSVFHQVKTEDESEDHHHEDHDDAMHSDNQRTESGHDGESASSSEESAYRSTSSSSGTARRQGRAKPKGKRVRRACVVPNCGKRSRSMGFCIAHGGGRRCAIPGCDKSSQGGNLCIKHGGGKRCRVDGCEKAAQTNALCKAHGGGPRCQFDDCEKSSQGGGFCRQHGGGKRCAYQDCMKGTQRGSYCALHGGSRLCIVEGCKRNDRGGGYCAHHGGGKRCSVDACNRPTRRNALCSTHLRLLGQTHSPQEIHDSIGTNKRAGDA